MPEIPRMPPGRRCFARIDRFECACPHCGRLIFAGIDKRFLPQRLVGNVRARAAAKQRPRADSILRLFWNPYTQRLCCPWCEHVYTVGVVFYPVTQGHRRIVDPAPDVVPTPAETAEMRRLAGGWWVKGGKRDEEYANQIVPAGCSCPEQGTEPSCPMHGAQALTATLPPPPPAPRYHLPPISTVSKEPDVDPAACTCYWGTVKPTCPQHGASARPQQAPESYKETYPCP